jgi:hypothetical protein
MIILEWPVVILALVPVVLIEAAVYRRRLGIAHGKALFPAGVANLASTFIGYPLAWILRLIGQIVLTLLLIAVAGLVGKWADAAMESIPGRLVGVVVSSAWLGPGAEDAPWMLPAASLVGLVPAFFISVYSEAWVLRRLMKVGEMEGQDKRAVLALSYRANLASYTLLVAIAAAILVRCLLRS